MKQFIVLVIACLVQVSLHAQDYHSSNYQNISQLYNPAIVGSRSDMEAAISYRTQWRAVGSPFNAIGASFYSTVEPDHRKQDGHLSLGINAYREQLSRTGSVTSITCNAAQHIFLSKTSSLSLGMNFGIFGTSIQEENGMWESQHNGLYFDQNLPSGENFESNSLMRFDIGSGIVYTLKDRKYSYNRIQAGFAAYHLNQPDLSYTSAVISTLPIRKVLYTTFAIPFGKKSSFVEGTMLYQNQRKFNSFTLGAMVKMRLTEKAKTTSSNANVETIYAGMGLYLRGKDAFIVNAQVQRTNWTLTFAYDMTISSLKSHSRGAVEFQLSYTIPKYERELMY